MCESKEHTREIPFDVVTEILMRLPAKSLMRFKSVSKLWSSLICSQCFTKRFLKVLSPQPRMYMLLCLKNKNVLLSASSSPDDPEVTTMYTDDRGFTTPEMKGHYVSHVFRGLMCLVKGQRAQIYNTTTRQLVVLPDIEESKLISEDHNEFKKVMYHIGYDPIHDQYKVVCIISRPIGEEWSGYMSEHWVLLLGGGGGDVSHRRWRKIPSLSPQHLTLSQGLTINGRMYYLAWVCLHDTVLVCLDINSEEISIHQVPEDMVWPLVDVIEYGGTVALLHLSYPLDESEKKLWVMEDAEKDKWSSNTLVLHPSQMNIVKMHMGDYTSFRVFGTTRNGEVILVPKNSGVSSLGMIMDKPQSTALFYVFLYNLQKNHIRKVEIIESSNRYLTKNWHVVGFDDVDNLLYL